MTDDPFHELIHRLRGQLIEEMPPAEVVVSVGCSGTWYFEWFNERYPHQVRRHIGFDLDPRPDELPQEIEYRQGNFCDLSVLADDTVDLIFAGQAIEHITTQDSYSFYEHAHRVLKQGGWLILDSPNFEVTREWPYYNPDHIIEYSPKQIQAILNAAGFRTVNRKGILLCKQDGQLIHDPYEFQRIDQRRIHEARARPEESFIWWIEAQAVDTLKPKRLKKELVRVNREYERQTAITAHRRQLTAAKEARKVTPKKRPPRSISRGMRDRVRAIVPRRVRWLGRVVYRLATGWYIRNLSHQLRGISENIVTQSAHIEAQGEVMDLMLRRLRRLEDGVAGFSETLAGLEVKYEEAHSRAMAAVSDADRRVAQLAPLSLASSMYWNLTQSTDSAESTPTVGRALSDFYVRFQDRHRGSEQLIRDRQRARVTRFESCKRVLDVGCGRGEFLDLLRERHIPGEGIDTSPGAVEQCRSKGHSVSQANALDFIASLSAGAFDGIHMSHLLEHMPFPSAVRLLTMCADQLPPDGILVAETPNPHCAEALQGFFLDPTHVRPLFPEALVVLLESMGFRDVQVQFVNASHPSEDGAAERSLQDCADYLIIGIKAAEQDVDAPQLVRSESEQKAAARD